MIIAYDFDGTVVEHKFPEIGEITELSQKVIDYLRSHKEAGDTLILWTCREDLPDRKYLTEAVQFCKNNNIPANFVNEYPMPKFKGFASRKVCADIYIDDKAVNINAFRYGGMNK